MRDTPGPPLTRCFNFNKNTFKMEKIKCSHCDEIVCKTSIYKHISRKHRTKLIYNVPRKKFDNYKRYIDFDSMNSKSLNVEIKRRKQEPGNEMIYVLSSLKPDSFKHGSMEQWNGEKNKLLTSRNPEVLAHRRACLTLKEKSVPELIANFDEETQILLSVIVSELFKIGEGVLYNPDVKTTQKLRLNGRNRPRKINQPNALKFSKKDFKKLWCHKPEIGKMDFEKIFKLNRLKKVRYSSPNIYYDIEDFLRALKQVKIISAVISADNALYLDKERFILSFFDKHRRVFVDFMTKDDDVVGTNQMAGENQICLSKPPEKFYDVSKMDYNIHTKRFYVRHLLDNGRLKLPEEESDELEMQLNGLSRRDTLTQGVRMIAKELLIKIDKKKRAKKIRKKKRNKELVLEEKREKQKRRQWKKLYIEVSKLSREDFRKKYYGKIELQIGQESEINEETTIQVSSSFTDSIEDFSSEECLELFNKIESIVENTMFEEFYHQKDIDDQYQFVQSPINVFDIDI